MDFNPVNLPQLIPSISAQDGNPLHLTSNPEILKAGQLLQFKEDLFVSSVETGALSDSLNLLSGSPTFLGADSLLVSPQGSSTPADSLTGKEASEQWVGQWSSDALVGDSLFAVSPTQQRFSHEIIFIDSTVEGYQSLLAGADSTAEVVLLDSTKDGIQQISQVLAQRNNITAIHIVSHGSNGNLLLGSTQLTSAELVQRADELRDWSTALAKDADILVYGCDLAAGEAGTAFIQQLSDLTGADIAASTNRTGSNALGGDWIFEVNSGSIEAGLAFSASAIANYNSVLAILLSGNQTFTGNTTLNEDIVVSGNAVLNVLGNLTIGNLGKVLGDGVGSLDNLTIKVSGNLIIGGNVGGQGLQDIAIEANGVNLLSGVGLVGDDFLLTAQVININSGATINATGRVDLTAIAQDQPISVGSKMLNVAKVNLAQGSSITATDISIKGSAFSSALSSDNGVHSELLIAGNITALNNILIESKTDNNFVQLDQTLAELTVASESIATAKIYDGAILSAGSNLRISAYTSGNLESILQTGSVETSVVESAIASIETATINVGSFNLNAQTSTKYSSIGQTVKNVISGDAQAYLLNSAVKTGNGNLSISAKDTSEINAKSADLSVDLDDILPGLQSPALLLANAEVVNELNRSVKAYVDSSDVTVTNGTLNVQALADTTVRATSKVTSVTASEALISTFSLSGGNTLATNNIRGEVTAYTANSNITTTGIGDVSITAQNTSQISATAESGMLATGGSGSGIGTSTAFNSIGWHPANSIFSSVDALLGTSFFGVEEGADTKAYMLDTSVVASGELAIAATSEINVSATVKNALTSNSSSSSSSGSSFGAVVALNKVSSGANASIDYSAGSVSRSIDAAGINVTGTDDVSISADVSLKAISETNDVSPFSNANSIGASGLVSLNDIRSGASASVNNAEVTSSGALVVQAIGSADISAKLSSEVASAGGNPFGSGTSFAANGLIATNAVLNGTEASISNSSLLVGDTTVAADNSASITAEVVNATKSGDQAIGATLAFNTIGWQPQNILFNTVDALIGDPAIADAFGASGGADTKAYLLNTSVNNTGALNLSATSTA
ncbi:DUF4347 domain-containing protein, partial [Oculatella sp. LEGE 06141]|uniref:DUF4347 domain-containing protein n=1 Tax=Oculatella sp. LEGE 06141 TaxID=1828648 RepID=UPI00187F3FE8|nr:DUF4347 domain-containing protein [Oculatella sp. LEGE 06141]